MTDMTDMPQSSGLTKRLPLIAILLVAAIGAFALRDHLSFQALADNREALIAFRDANYGLTVLAIVGAWRSFPRITIPQRAAFLIPLATYPLIYYIVAYMPRYRIPIDWILYILAGAAIWGLIDGSLRTGRAA